MRLFGLVDARVDWSERAAWVTPPFDLPLRRPRTAWGPVGSSARLQGRIGAGGRLDGAVAAGSRMAARVNALRGQ